MSSGVCLEHQKLYDVDDMSRLLPFINSCWHSPFDGRRGLDLFRKLYFKLPGSRLNVCSCSDPLERCYQCKHLSVPVKGTTKARPSSDVNWFLSEWRRHRFAKFGSGSTIQTQGQGIIDLEAICLNFFLTHLKAMVTRQPPTLQTGDYDKKGAFQKCEYTWKLWFRSL